MPRGEPAIPTRATEARARRTPAPGLVRTSGPARMLRALVAVGVAVAALLLVARGREDLGQARFFRNQTYHFQTLRVFSDIPFGGADTGEILETVRQVHSGDAQSWHAAWSATGERVLALAEATQDRESRGLALLRAHNYLRTAEFLLPPDDPKRLPTFDRSVSAFYAGLRTLGVAHEVSEVPYAGTTLTSVFYPGPAGAADKPLIVLFGGYDSTLEELYFVLVAAAHQRGYAVLTYEGPGQGAALRKRGLKFTHEWEKPTAAVLDAWLASHPRPPKLVLVGMSMGGFLAPRAAAFDPRFDGVVAYDVFYDLAETGRRYVPPLAFWLHDHGLDAVLSAIVSLKAWLSPDFRWMYDNARWVMGTTGPIDSIRAFDPYTLEDVAGRIRADVLILAGEDDHFVPLSQVTAFEKSLTEARSVTVRVYDRASGGAEHCQLGAHTLWHRDFFDWMMVRFGGA